NCTFGSEFLITGFNKLDGLKIPLFILFLTLYLAACIENILIIMLVTTSTHLQTPMYFILCSLSCCELMYITTMVPKMLYDILSERATISFIGCLTQLQLYGTIGNTMSYHYSLMSYDRYIAISNPLQYSSVINNRFCLCFIIGFWIISFASLINVPAFISHLTFCDPNIIDHFHCDLFPLIELSYSDTTLLLIIIAAQSSFITMLPLLFVFSTYTFIMYTILKIPSTTGRKKAFSTCSSHLIVIAINYGLIVSVYVLPKRVTSLAVTKGLSFLYFLVIPLLTPMIYTLRNKDIHKALTRK
ncbi:olfactory receptor 6N1-like, partial [Pelobates cultripes]